MLTLAKVRTDVLCHPLDDQVVVYDPKAECMHLLDKTTACVMDLLKEGGRSVDEITIELARRTGFQPSPGLLMLALEELRRTDLLDESDGPRKKLSGGPMFRRAMLKKVASAGAATFLIPAVITLWPNSVRGQASTCIPHDDCCTPGDTCCNAKDNCEPHKCNPTGFHCH